MIDDIKDRVLGYEWGLKRPLIPLAIELDVEKAYAAAIHSSMEALYDALAHPHEPTGRGLEAFKKGVRDALPLYVEGEGRNFSIFEIASAIGRDESYVRAEVARGKLEADREGKLWLISPSAFEKWYAAKKRRK